MICFHVAYHHHQLPSYGSFWGQKAMALAKHMESVSAQVLTDTWTIAGDKQIQGHQERNLAFKSQYFHSCNQ